jgi:hypothetical protein
VANGGDEIPKRDESFVDLLNRASAAAAPRKLPTRLRPQLVDLTEVRNLALHRGVAVDQATARRGAETARRMLDALPALLDRDLRLTGDAGVASAVASRLEDKRVAEHLVAAEASLRAGDHLQAAAWLSSAWIGAMSRARLRTSGYGTPDKSARIGAVERLSHEVAINDVWISRLAVGLEPKSLVRLGEVLGSHPRGNPPKVQRYGLDDPSHDDVVWALGRVTEVIYKLWAGGLLEPAWWERAIAGK